MMEFEKKLRKPDTDYVYWVFDMETNELIATFKTYREAIKFVKKSDRDVRIVKLIASYY
jgi:hypothetical protein